MKLHSHLVEGKLFNNMIIQFSKKFNEFNPLVSTYFCIDIDPLWIAKLVYYGFDFDMSFLFQTRLNEIIMASVLKKRRLLLKSF